MMFQVIHKYVRNSCRDVYMKVELEDWVTGSMRGVEEVESRMIPNFMIVSIKKTITFKDCELKKKKKSDWFNNNKFSFDCVIPAWQWTSQVEISSVVSVLTLPLRCLTNIFTTTYSKLKSRFFLFSDTSK